VASYIKKFIIKPSIIGDLNWVACWHDSNFGRIDSNWKRDDHQWTMDVTMPANTTATVYVPTSEIASVNESGKPVSRAEGVKFPPHEEGICRFCRIFR
jgi:alpha-L-rhamnosidase